MKFNGETLKAIRMKKLTQTLLARMIGKSKKSISRYERGELTPNTATVKMLCNVLGVSENELMGETYISEAKKLISQSKELDDFFKKAKEILTVIKDYSIEDQESILNITKESLKFYKKVNAVEDRN